MSTRIRRKYWKPLPPNPDNRTVPFYGAGGGPAHVKVSPEWDVSDNVARYVLHFDTRYDPAHSHDWRTPSPPTYRKRGPLARFVRRVLRHLVARLEDHV